MKWNVNADIDFTKNENKTPLVWFVRQIIRKKISLLKFKLLWDAQFDEQAFLSKSRLAVALLTKYINANEKLRISECTTPMGYKQLMQDVSNTRSDKYKLLCFEKRHIWRSIPIQIRRWPHNEHNFAFIDVVFQACRHANDFTPDQQAQEIRKLIFKHHDGKQLYLRNPIVYAELFTRFRRDYSFPATVQAGHWLVSSFKPLRLDVLDDQPAKEISKLPDELQGWPHTVHDNAVYQ